jgi:hypothetical protein
VSKDADINMGRVKSENDTEDNFYHVNMYLSKKTNNSKACQ